MPPARKPRFQTFRAAPRCASLLISSKGKGVRGLQGCGKPGKDAVGQRQQDSATSSHRSFGRRAAGMITEAIKRARFLGMLPYVGSGTI